MCVCVCVCVSVCVCQCVCVCVCVYLSVQALAKVLRYSILFNSKRIGFSQFSTRRFLENPLFKPYGVKKAIF